MDPAKLDHGARPRSGRFKWDAAGKCLILISDDGRYFSIASPKLEVLDAPLSLGNRKRKRLSGIDYETSDRDGHHIDIEADVRGNGNATVAGGDVYLNRIVHVNPNVNYPIRDEARGEA